MAPCEVKRALWDEAGVGAREGIVEEELEEAMFAGLQVSRPVKYQKDRATYKVPNRPTVRRPQQMNVPKVYLASSKLFSSVNPARLSAL